MPYFFLSIHKNQNLKVLLIIYSYKKTSYLKVCLLIVYISKKKLKQYLICLFYYF